jgi:HlyD family secretion protein
MRPHLLLFPVLLLAACSGSDAPTFQGYVEGDFVDLAPEVGGRIAELAAHRGDAVKTGDLLFRLDDAEAKAAVAQAQAELQRAEAELDNLREGQRPPEIAVIDAQIAEAKAALDKARSDFARQQTLFDRRVISAAQLDSARESIRISEARVASAERQKDVAAMPARTPEIQAGVRAVESARAALDQATIRLAKYDVGAPATGRIEDVYYEMGEVANAGAPVLSLLPDDARKVIFFVLEAERTALATGGTVALACDGCPANLSAEIRFLGTEAEYTPPIIFSRENRGKLMFRAEASLSGDAARLPVGQPVDVTSASRSASDGGAQ